MTLDFGCALAEVSQRLMRLTDIAARYAADLLSSVLSRCMVARLFHQVPEVYQQ